MKASVPQPPVAPTRPHALVAHGHRREDPWYWLRDRAAHEVLEYLAAENEYTDARMEPTRQLQAELYAELRSHVQEDDASAPTPWGPWRYRTRTVAGQEYPIHERAALGSESFSIVLDENALAGESDYFALGECEISADHRFAAYAVDFSGGELYQLRIRDLDRGIDLDDVIDDVYYGVAWSADATVVFYTRTDDAMRPHQVWRHTIGAPIDTDVLVYEDSDDRFEVWVEASRSNDYIFVGSQSKITSEVHWLDAHTPSDSLRCIQPRVHGVEYRIDQQGASFVMLTNADGNTNFELRTAPITTERREWEPVVVHDPLVRIASATVFADFIVLYERMNGLERLRVRHNDGRIDTIPMTDPIYTVWPGSNRNYSTTVVRYQYSSLVQPRAVFDYDVATGGTQLIKEQPTPGYDRDRYTTYREWAVANDGTRIPMSVVHRTDVERDGSAPLYLYGYGSYEASMDPAFDIDVLPMLDRGWVYVIAHPRGGGEMGRDWYEHGKLEHKMNTFTDFIACADHLAASQLVDQHRIIARGASAGGLLMGAVANLRPDRWRGIVAQVPFVDVVTTMSDVTIPLTAGEWDEWGNPLASESDYHRMLAYSPYDNLSSEARYPSMLITAGLNDPRVQYWEPVKYTAKLRALNPSSDVLLRTEMGAGHGGPSGRYEQWKEEAFVLAWMLTAAGDEPG